MTISEIETRAAELTEMLKAEDADLDAIETEIRELEDKKAELRNAQEARNTLAEQIASGKIGKTTSEIQENKTMTNNEIRNTQEYIDAFAHYARTGDDKECRALLTENATNGVLPVPTFVGEIIAEALKESPILNRVRKVFAKGNFKQPFEYSAPAATIHEEGAEAQAEEQLLIGTVALTPQTWKKWVGISTEALDMNSESYLRYIYEEIARGIVKAREDAVVAALLAAPATADATHPAVPKTGTAAGAITDIVNARALLSSAARDLVILMTPSQYATYRGYQMGSNYGADPFDGLTVLFNDTVSAPLVGDLNGVMEVLPNGETPYIMADEYTKKKEDIVEILGRLPGATAVVGNKYFAKVSA